MQSFDDVVLIQVTLHINYILLTQISRCGGGCGGGGGGGGQGQEEKGGLTGPLMQSSHCSVIWQDLRR